MHLQPFLQQIPLYDFSRCRQTATPSRQFPLYDCIRHRKMGIIMQSIQQRGQVSVSIDSEVPDRTMLWREEWFLPAMVVQSTRAVDLFPALRKHFPPELDFTESSEAVKTAIASVDALTFAPCCDSASGNISILKYIGRIFRINNYFDQHIASKNTDKNI